MGWSQVGTAVTAAFADGSTGHVVDYGSAPAAGDFDIIFVNSDTVVTTPSGFTLPAGASQVSNQGAYGYYRKATGGEGSTVTIQTSGNFNTVVSWVRWRGGNAFDVAVGAQINSTVGGATPSITTGALAESGELVVAAALLHRLASPEPNTPVWSSGYMGLTAVTQGTGTSGCTQFTAYKTGAGTAAETPSCTWTDGAFDRYAIALAFTAAPASASGSTAVATGSATAAKGVKGGTGSTSQPGGSKLTAAGVKGGLVSPPVKTGSTMAAKGAKATAGQSAQPSASSIATRGAKATSKAAAIPASITITPGTSKGGQGPPAQPAGAGLAAAGSKTGEAAPSVTATGSLTAAGIKSAARTATQHAAHALSAAGMKNAVGTCRMSAGARIRPSATAESGVDLTVSAGSPRRGWSAGAPWI